MSNNIIFYTQVASIIVFVLALFGIYRLLIAQKDAVIELKREQIDHQERKLKELQAQSPDVLVKTLSERIEIAEKEIDRLRQDGDKHSKEIEKKESELNKTKGQLSSLMEVIKDTEFVCPFCDAPLSQRGYYPIYDYINGREVAVEAAEYSIYECGLEVRDGVEETPCNG